MENKDFQFTNEEHHKALVILNNMVSDRMSMRSGNISTIEYEIAINHGINDALSLFQGAIKRNARTAN